LSDFAFYDGGPLTFLILFVLMCLSIFWGRHLRKQDARFQSIIDIVAIVLSGLVVLSFAMRWTAGLFGFIV